jgi:hypothetical protein
MGAETLSPHCAALNQCASAVRLLAQQHLAPSPRSGFVPPPSPVVFGKLRNDKVRPNQEDPGPSRDAQKQTLGTTVNVDDDDSSRAKAAKARPWRQGARGLASEHTDQGRNDALNNPSVRTIITTRGGKGAFRIADGPDFSAMRADPKILIGFSGTRILHLALWHHAGVPVIHGAWRDCPNPGVAASTPTTRGTPKAVAEQRGWQRPLPT